MLPGQQGKPRALSGRRKKLFLAMVRTAWPAGFARRAFVSLVKLEIELR